MKRQFSFVYLDRTRTRGNLSRDRVATLLRCARSRGRIAAMADPVKPIRSPDPTLDAYMIGSMLIYPAIRDQQPPR